MEAQGRRAGPEALFTSAVPRFDILRFAVCYHSLSGRAGPTRQLFLPFTWRVGPALRSAPRGSLGIFGFSLGGQAVFPTCNQQFDRVGTTECPPLYGGAGAASRTGSAFHFCGSAVRCSAVLRFVVIIHSVVGRVPPAICSFPSPGGWDPPYDLPPGGPLGSSVFRRVGRLFCPRGISSLTAWAQQRAHPCMEAQERRAGPEALFTSAVLRFVDSAVLRFVVIIHSVVGRVPPANCSFPAPGGWDPPYDQPPGGPLGSSDFRRVGRLFCPRVISSLTAWAQQRAHPTWRRGAASRSGSAFHFRGSAVRYSAVLRFVVIIHSVVGRVPPANSFLPFTRRVGPALTISPPGVPWDLRIFVGWAGCFAHV